MNLLLTRMDQAASEPTHIVLWLTDTRDVWHGNDITSAAADVLRHLSREEQDRARAYYFVKDAKLSVAASLLKRRFVASATPLRWKDIVFRRKGDAKHGKPCYIGPSADSALLDFNVSHQNGLAALAGCLTSQDDVGIDIVSVEERSHTRMIKAEGFEAFVDMHRDVFSDADLQQIKDKRGSTLLDKDAQLESRIRTFYAFWCIKEAYVKMVGEGLLDPWIRDVEFRNVSVPQAVHLDKTLERHSWGERVQSIEVWLHGQRLEDVSVCLEAFEGQYMIATALRCRCANRSAHVPRFQIVQPEAAVPHSV